MGNRNMKNIFILGFMIVVLGGCTSQWKIDKAAMHTDLGIAYINSTQYTNALRELLQAEDLNSDDPRTHYFLGVIYMVKDMREKAVEEFKKTVSLKSDFSQAYTYLGSIYNGMGLYDQAIDAFNKALANLLYDAPAAALYNMGWSYYKKGDYKTAMAKYEEAKAKDANTPLLPGIEKNMGIVSCAQGNADRAVKHFKRSLELVPDFQESYYELGVCYLNQKRNAEAASAFQAAVKLSPESEYGTKAREALRSINR